MTNESQPCPRCGAYHFPNILTRKEEYQQYLQSACWKGFSKALKSLFRRCDLCNAPRPLEVHHQDYRNFPGQEKVSDIMVLCRACHERMHADV